MSKSEKCKMSRKSNTLNHSMGQTSFDSYLYDHAYMHIDPPKSVETQNMEGCSLAIQKFVEYILSQLQCGELVMDTLVCLAWKKGMKSNMSKLPNELVMEIFCKMSMKTILQCRRVCKLWRFLLSDPRFAQLHSQRTKSPSSTTLMIRTSWCSDDELETTDHQSYIVEPQASAITKVTTRFPDLNFAIYGSCNGLLYIANEWSVSKRPVYYISNPITGEYVALPKPKPRFDDYHIVNSGFGFSSETNQYKVVRIFFGERRRWEAEIYTLGGACFSWTSIGFCPFIPSEESPIFLNGSLHWTTDTDDKSCEQIWALDIGNEEFRPISFPFEKCFRCLGVLRGCLYARPYFDGGDDGIIKIWVMKVYGVKESWTQEVEIKGPGDVINDFRFITCLRNGRILILSGLWSSRLISYDPTTASFEPVHLPNVPLSHDQQQLNIHVIPYVPILVSLKCIIKTGEVQHINQLREARDSTSQRILSSFCD